MYGYIWRSQKKSWYDCFKLWSHYLTCVSCWLIAGWTTNMSYQFTYSQMDKSFDNVLYIAQKKSDSFTQVKSWSYALKSILLQERGWVQNKLGGNCTADEKTTLLYPRANFLAVVFLTGISSIVYVISNICQSFHNKLSPQQRVSKEF